MTSEGRGLSRCVCMGDRQPNTKRCSRWADPNREDGLCSACALPDSYCREFRDEIAPASTPSPTGSNHE